MIDMDSELTSITEDELLERYDSCLDEIYPDLKICGYNYSSSEALRKLDPIAYRCGFNDWLDTELTDGIFEVIDDNYFERL